MSNLKIIILYFFLQMNKKEYNTKEYKITDDSSIIYKKLDVNNIKYFFYIFNQDQIKLIEDICDKLNFNKYSCQVVIKHIDDPTKFRDHKFMLINQQQENIEWYGLTLVIDPEIKYFRLFEGCSVDDIDESILNDKYYVLNEKYEYVNFKNKK